MSPNFHAVNRARTKARRNTVQALYGCYMTGKDVADVIAEFERDEHRLTKTDVDYFKALLNGIIKHNAGLDERLAGLLDRPLEQLDAIERAILQIGCYELVYHHEIPWRVVVNESIELAKLFGAEESYKYVNGVLDKVARELRSTEIDNIA